MKERQQHIGQRALEWLLLLIVGGKHEGTSAAYAGT
jgi:hypothetical protein